MYIFTLYYNYMHFTVVGQILYDIIIVYVALSTVIYVQIIFSFEKRGQELSAGFEVLVVRLRRICRMS